MAGSDLVMLFWALSKVMAGSYRNRSTESTEYVRITIQPRIMKVTKRRRGEGKE